MRQIYNWTSKAACGTFLSLWVSYAHDNCPNLWVKVEHNQGEGKRRFALAKSLTPNR